MAFKLSYHKIIPEPNKSQYHVDRVDLDENTGRELGISRIVTFYGDPGLNRSHRFMVAMDTHPQPEDELSDTIGC